MYRQYTLGKERNNKLENNPKMYELFRKCYFIKETSQQVELGYCLYKKLSNYVNRLYPYKPTYRLAVNVMNMMSESVNILNIHGLVSIITKICCLSFQFMKDFFFQLLKQTTLPSSTLGGMTLYVEYGVKAIKPKPHYCFVVK